MTAQHNAHPANCRACGAPLTHSMVDLGLSPVSNAFIRPENIAQGEMFYPLHAMVCDHCWLVQLRDATPAETHFHDDYVYFSSFSTSWLDHARRYVGAMTARFGLGKQSRVMEIASNDGYLLQYFHQNGVPCLGIEPSANTGAAARAKGIDSRELFFGERTARALSVEGWQVDLLLGNNVLAHVPDINDFVGGMPLVLKAEGVVTLEFPHLLRLLEQNQFDTLYHEHYSYLSLTALVPILARAGLRVFDIEHLPTHGGSLRLFACHQNARHATTAAVPACLDEETRGGLNATARYTAFAEGVRRARIDLLAFLIDARRQGKRVAAYGAAAKGNTLLNYCGIDADLVEYVVDRNPAKQDKLLPGSRIPVHAPEVIDSRKPDYLLILPWNIKDEVMEQMAGIRAWGGRFVVAIPETVVLP
ncbi:MULTISPECIES: class I SAM-dependent methyltransferase [unclassified Cupriavidus]|uniref:class I SAM-dependent methyltransferase n=1 Tax=unclassified Cupriavidus TaxID=2640874 RepID=UPI001C004F20|nr:MULTISPECIES: class I SAM-dependent methyltransferase [unclassified Cupriavidus]MCA3182045.1 methyltransferase domain-containing protein [Cupriavidus sp.]MCA3192487.1 methyltransferase domain-containing protein [Cupriavidus sp.]MCA3198901.1 methyltransferase domain-containing protein [Cupriavidus sp.]MCA3205263.1 methyltransferase domain-containing protein [Cupriavidus sp.]MCA3207303.1 methyltransferase domain-containing protein [Cupriavidus sp.]